MRTRKKVPRGFTLIELTITIAVSSIMVVGMVQAMQQQVVVSVETRDYLVAMNIARMKMGEIRAGSYPSVGTATLAAESAFPGYMSQRVVTDVVSSGGLSVRQVQVDVARSGGSFSSPIVSLITYLTSVTTFGDGL